MEESRKQFSEQLSDLRSGIIRLSAMASEAIGAGTQALLDADLGLVDGVIRNNRPMSELKAQLEFGSYRILAQQQPTAADLRMLLAVLRILHELELTGDLMVSVAKATRRLYPQELHPKVRGLVERMGAQASVQLHLAIDSFADSDARLSGALVDMDDVMDDLQKELFRTIFEVTTPDEAGLQQAVQIALVGRFYERMADHAVQIGRWVNFMVTGEMPGVDTNGTFRE